MATPSWAAGSYAMGQCPDGRAATIVIRPRSLERRSCWSPGVPCNPPWIPHVVSSSSSVVRYRLSLNHGASISLSSSSIFQDTVSPSISLMWPVLVLPLSGRESGPANLTRIVPPLLCRPTNAFVVVAVLVLKQRFQCRSPCPPSHFGPRWKWRHLWHSLRRL